jgi:hypothetical protein
MPSREHVRRAMQAMKLSADVAFFFEKLTSPDWIVPLREEGLFNEPWAPQREGEYISFPFWPPAQYLARMASAAPEAVMDVILSVPPTENVRVHESFVDAALAMPPAIAAQLVPVIGDWLGSPYVLLLPEKVGKLVAHLGASGESAAALQLAAVLLAVRPDPRAAAAGQGLWRRRPHGGMEDYFYKENLKRDLPVLLAADPSGTLEMLADRLQEAVEVSVTPQPEHPREDYSYAWQSAVEEHEQNSDFDVRAPLVAAVRDAAASAVAADAISLEELVRRLHARPWKIFTRIALATVSVDPTRDPALTKRLVFDPALADDVGLHHEYWRLAATVFPSLEADEQRAFLDRLKAEAEEGQQEAEKESSPKEIEHAKRLARHTWLRRLTLLKEHLPEAARHDFDELRKEFPEVEHPDLLSYSMSWTGPTSPKSVADLTGMPVPELVELLRSWRPSGQAMDHSPEGLSRTLTAAVGDTPERYAERALEFRGLDPTYVRGLLNGLRGARKARRPFDWEPVLGLCEWVVQQPREITGRHGDAEERDLDPDWGWTRKEVAGLLEDGFDDGDGILPAHLQGRVRAILESLADDPDPTPEHERRYGGDNMDPFTLSINAVRGVAINAVVRFALWVRRRQEAQGDGAALAQGFASTPGVQQLLERHLDLAVDPSLSTRAVFGRWLPWLLLIDPAWTRAHLGLIFPHDPAQRALRNAAWSAYVLYSGVFNDVLELLRDEYRFAVERIGQEDFGGGHAKEVDHHLADHLMIFYMRGLLGLDADSLLDLFFRTAPSGTRTRALGFVGHALTDEKAPALPVDVRQRLEQLLDWRLGSAVPWAERADELAEFGWWFGSAKLDAAWALPRLLAILRSARKLEAEHLVVQQLEVLSASDPGGAVEALKWVVEVDRRGWSFGLWEEAGRRILRRALDSGRTAASVAATDTIDLLVARGNRAFADLVSTR